MSPARAAEHVHRRAVAIAGSHAAAPKRDRPCPSDNPSPPVRAYVPMPTGSAQPASESEPTRIIRRGRSQRGSVRPTAPWAACSAGSRPSAVRGSVTEMQSAPSDSVCVARFMMDTVSSAPARSHHGSAPTSTGGVMLRWKGQASTTPGRHDGIEGRGERVLPLHANR